MIPDTPTSPLVTVELLHHLIHAGADGTEHTEPRSTVDLGVVGVP
jgi:hypothetical protein